MVLELGAQETGLQQTVLALALAATASASEDFTQQLTGRTNVARFLADGRYSTGSLANKW